MKKTLVALVAAGTLAASLGAPAAQARGFGHGGGFRGHGGGFHRGYGGGSGHRGIGTGAAVGLGLLGAGIAGAAIAGSQGYGGGYPAYGYGGAYPAYPYGGYGY